MKCVILRKKTTGHAQFADTVRFLLDAFGFSWAYGEQKPEVFSPFTLSANIDCVFFGLLAE